MLREIPLSNLLRIVLTPFLVRLVALRSPQVTRVVVAALQVLRSRNFFLMFYRTEVIR